MAAAVAAALAALAEAGALILLATVAARATRDDDDVLGRIGPFEIDLGTGRMLLLVLALVLLSTLAKVAALWVRTRTTRSWERRERIRALDAQLAARYEYTSQLSPAELQALVGGHIAQAARGLDIIGMVVNSAISFSILVLVAFSTAPIAALVIAAVGGALLGILRPLANKTRHAGKQSSIFEIESARLVSDTARDGREIRIFGAQRHFLDRYTHAVTQAAETRRRIGVISGLAPILYQGFGLLIVVVSLGLALSIGDLEVATLGAVALLFLRSLGYGQALSGTQQQYAEMVPFVERLDRDLDRLREERAVFGDVGLGAVESIVLRDVGYHYPTAADLAEEALRGVSLELAPPGIVGLVGPSGSGKSTLAQLLLRLRTPSTGAILVNGRSIDAYSAETWTAQVALVPQHPQLIRGTVRDNISFHRPGVTDEAVWRVLADVGLDALVESLTDGLDTELGETNRELSGGQLQRVGIARALLCRPSLLVLDEPTSALDAETEEWVQRAIDTASQHALVLIITHRSSTLAACGRVIRLEAGRLVSDERRDSGTVAPAAPPA